MPGKKKEIQKKNEPKYQILLFGKAGCDKCAILEKRLDNLLATEKWSDFSKIKFDLESEEGLVEFCSIECMNPQRVPGFVVAKKNSQSGKFELLPNQPKNSRSDDEDICGNSRLYTWLGLQTDYTDQGGGVISPKMITTILTEAQDQRS